LLYIIGTRAGIRAMRLKRTEELKKLTGLLAVGAILAVPANAVGRARGRLRKGRPGVLVV